jgi:neutral ceramidase
MFRWMAIELIAISMVAPAWAGLRAGVSNFEITPKTHEVMWGFEDRLAPAESTLDPLYARVLVLEAGNKRLALVALDLGRSFGEPSLDRLHQAALKSSGISCILAAASHTHSAPVIKDEYDGEPPAWERLALAGIGSAIEKATGNLQEAKIGAGTGAVYIGHNRLPLRPDGTFGWFERNPTMIPTSPVDPTVTVIRVDGSDGAPMAILVNYACHPVVLGSDNRQYSADFPGAMNGVVEAAFAGHAMSFFLQGAPGDINPYHAVTPIAEDAVKMRDWTGERLAAEVVRVAKEIHTEDTSPPSIEIREESLRFHLRWNQEKFQAALLKFLGPKTLELQGSPIHPEIESRVAAVLINKQIAIATFPGEPFVDFQKNWRDRCPVPTALLFGYTNGYHGYFPTISATARGGYGAASASTWVEPGAGERIVDWAVVKTYDMLGKLSDLPDDLKRDVYK